MSRSDFAPFAVPVLLVLAAHLLWLCICGGLTVIHDFLHGLPSSLSF
jgi:hypothetical protein